jgi:antirestriction protein ArdC
MTEKAKAVLDGLVEKINSETASQFVRERIELFSDGSDIPCRRWSLMNQMSVFLSGTHDARGIRQWNMAGRKVKKGAHALYIFVPMLYAVPKKKPETDEAKSGDEDEAELPLQTITGFKEMPVFRVEDTEGAPLDYEERIKALDVDSLPLIDVAKSLGVKVEAGLTSAGVEGWFRKSTKQIRLGTANPVVFLHELSHAVDNALPDRSDSYAFNEVVAELSAAFLASLYGVKFDIALTQGYIKYWQGKGHVMIQVVDALKRVEQIYKFIDGKKKRRKRSDTVVSPTRAVIALPEPEQIAAYAQLLTEPVQIKNRSQTYNPRNGKWVKRDEVTGHFRSVKKDGLPFRRVAREMPPDWFPAA